MGRWYPVSSNPRRSGLPTRITRRTLLAGAGGAAMLAGYHYLVNTIYDDLSPVVNGRRAMAGYVPYYDQPAAFRSATDHLAVFDEIHPVWYSLDTAGEVVLADDKYSRVDMAQADRLQADGVRVLPTCTNLRNGDWAPHLVTAMLADRAISGRHVDALVELAVNNDYDGIDIDYEDLGPAHREPYSRFLRDLGAALRAEGKLLTSAVYAKQSEPGAHTHAMAQDYAAIGEACDQVRVMAYDYRWEDSDPGPVAPRRWVEDVVAWSVSQVPRSKLRLGIVLLGYDWVAGAHGETVTYAQATRRADKYDAAVLDHDSGTAPHFTYADERGRHHHVWFEDALSSAAKLELVEQYDLGGAFFWRLGGEDPRTWELIDLG